VLGPTPSFNFLLQLMFCIIENFYRAPKLDWCLGTRLSVLRETKNSVSMAEEKNADGISYSGTLPSCHVWVAETPSIVDGGIGRRISAESKGTFFTPCDWGRHWVFHPLKCSPEILEIHYWKQREPIQQLSTGRSKEWASGGPFPGLTLLSSGKGGLTLEQQITSQAQCLTYSH